MPANLNAVRRLTAHPHRPHSRTSAEDTQGVEITGISIVKVDDCAGRAWWASPRRRTVYYWSGLHPVAALDAIIHGITALRAHLGRPQLHLIHSAPAQSEA